MLAPSCPNLGTTVENGEVTYSRDRQSSGRYSTGTTATVECGEGYSGGDITCQADSTWSDRLPNCTSESVIILYYMYNIIIISQQKVQVVLVIVITHLAGSKCFNVRARVMQ